MYRVILCGRTNRVIFFTNVDAASVRASEHTYMATFDAVPEAMTLGNCWDYAYRDGKSLQHVPGPKKAVRRTLFENNLAEARDQLRKHLNAAVQKTMNAVRPAKAELLTPETMEEIAALSGKSLEALRSELLAAQAAHAACVNGVEHNRAKFSAALDRCTTAAEVAQVRDVFANVDLSKKVKA
jgi:hypothetical protein